MGRPHSDCSTLGPGLAMRVPCPAARITTTPALRPSKSDNLSQNKDLDHHSQQPTRRAACGTGWAECTSPRTGRSSRARADRRAGMVSPPRKVGPDSTLVSKDRPPSLLKTQLDPSTELGLDLARRKFRRGVLPCHFRSSSMCPGRVHRTDSIPTLQIRPTGFSGQAPRTAVRKVVRGCQGKQMKRPPLRSFT